jgi:hypothetical protein
MNKEKRSTFCLCKGTSFIILLLIYNYSNTKSLIYGCIAPNNTSQAKIDLATRLNTI